MQCTNATEYHLSPTCVCKCVLVFQTSLPTYSDQYFVGIALKQNIHWGQSFAALGLMPNSLPFGPKCLLPWPAEVTGQIRTDDGLRMSFSLRLFLQAKKNKAIHTLCSINDLFSDTGKMSPLYRRATPVTDWVRKKQTTGKLLYLECTRDTLAPGLTLIPCCDLDLHTHTHKKGRKSIPQVLTPPPATLPSVIQTGFSLCNGCHCQTDRKTNAANSDTSAVSAQWLAATPLQPAVRRPPHKNAPLFLAI